MELFLLALWVLAILAPLVWAWREKASIAMAMTLSLLFGYIVQLIWVWTGYNYLVVNLWMVPAWVEQGRLFTLISAGFAHSPSDPLHVLGNIVIIALVGIPLEQRLGRGRWLISYIIGLLGGSIAWTLANPGSYVPALGASGAAFGILGTYLAGWPNDKVYFPFIIIRPWPVQFIALVYFGMEVVKAWQVYGFEEVSDVAHMAHLGGFILAYFTLPLVKKGSSWTPVEQMIGLPSDHPFIGLDELITKLRDEGDEKETRQAWMEEISVRADCPVCSGKLVVENLRIKCADSKLHLHWP